MEEIALECFRIPHLDAVVEEGFEPGAVGIEPVDLRPLSAVRIVAVRV